jgi:hypothetical protein
MPVGHREPWRQTCASSGLGTLYQHDPSAIRLTTLADFATA